MKHPPHAQAAYLWALMLRFKVTLILGCCCTAARPGYLWRCTAMSRAMLPYVQQPLLEILNLCIPPFGVAVVVDGLVRFGYLFAAKRRGDREWIEVYSHLLKEHVIICGAGRVGYRVVQQLLALGREVVVVDKKEDAAFVTVLRDLEVVVLIDDIKSPACLKRLNLAAASAVVCATDDDLANLNIALDACRIKPEIRIVIRLFDDDLVARVRETFNAEALSSSALAAPALALSALDPRITHSFQLGPHLMVVSVFKAHHGLPELTLGELTRRFGGWVLSLQRAQLENLNPAPTQRIVEGDKITIQATFAAYQELRAFTGEVPPPVSWQHG